MWRNSERLPSIFKGPGFNITFFGTTTFIKIK